MKNNISQVKWGALFSYVIMLLNIIYGLVLTPYIVSHLGTGDYGVYKTITSLTATLAVMDIGIGGTVQRYVASYIAKSEQEKIPNFLAMAFIIALLLCVLFSIVSICVYFMIDGMYASSFDVNQIVLAKKIFVISAGTILVHILETVLSGLINGHNRFIFVNGINALLIIVRILSIVVFLSKSRNAVGIVIIFFAVNIILIFAECLYAKRLLLVQIKLTKWDMSLFREAGKYTLLAFVISITSQMTTNLDNVIIGAIKGPNLVAIYSVGLYIFEVFQTISYSISGVMLPTVTGALEENNDEKIKSIIVRAGRVQFILLAPTIVGFVCIGKDFVRCWMGSGFEDVYTITLILIVPSLFELCINTCLSILRAKNMLGFRTIALSTSAVINAFITILLVKYWSYIGAAVGTALSYILCSLAAMNVYYNKKLGLPMLDIYKQIVGNTWISLLVSGLGLCTLSQFLNGSWIAIIIDITVFCAIYGFMLYKIGLTESERAAISLAK